jgi:hypothetical protein
MNLYKRPEKETDPNKLPGQIINRPPGPDTLQHNIEQYQQYEAQRNRERPDYQPRMADGCCHKTVFAGWRCIGCPFDDRGCDKTY